MRRLLLPALFGLILLLPPAAEARREKGFYFDEHLTVDNETLLRLNGVGFLEKFSFTVYANTLYLKQPSSDWQTILDTDEPMAMRLHILYSFIDLGELKEALRDGFRYSTGRDPEKLKPLLARSEKLLSWFDRKTRKYDTATFLYVPGKGTMVSMNGTYKGTIPGFDFKKALFGIWLCEKPANRPLKAGLLGLPEK